MKLRQNAKRIFSAALVLWMSGIIVLFCCSNMPTAHAASQEIESCPLAKKSDCTKTSANDSEYSFSKQSKAFDCCAFPAKIFDKTRKIEKSPEAVAIAETIEIKAPEFSLIEKTSAPPKFYQSFARDRGSTYLQNCVFRI